MKVRNYLLNKTSVRKYGIFLLVIGLTIVAAVLVSTFVVQRVKETDTVSFHYTLSFDDGSVYYSSFGDKPRQYALGEGMLLPDFEAALIGMQVGDSKTVNLPFTQAYGPYQPQLIMEVSRSELPEGAEPMVGQQLQTTSQSGNPLTVTITEVTESTVTLDANHPLAGQNLTFDVQIIGIEKNLDSNTGNYLGWIILFMGVLASVYIFRNREDLRSKTVAGKLRARKLAHR